MKIKTVWVNFISLLYPKLCVICGEPLIENEKFFCFACFLKLPRTNYHLIPENRAIERLAGKVSLEKASSYFYYNKGGVAQKLISEIKYKGNRDLGEWIGSYLAKDMISSGFFQGIDYMVPVPLHRSKEKKRGFNQAEKIARGIAQVTKIPLETSNVLREKANTSQTKKGIFDRWKNTRNLFNLKDPELFKKKHILLIDDVLTTGSTLEAVAQSLLKSQGVKISILTLAIT
ncbi:MAG: ComF family protein [Candidatus Azobacteroides sp.]|nr:ComF family protein [Candidatus Azobacteroides sp.]